jgi:hypothetical protein
MEKVNAQNFYDFISNNYQELSRYELKEIITEFIYQATQEAGEEITAKILQNAVDVLKTGE